MDRKTFVSRLSKCSKESIVNYLSTQFKKDQVINEIELIEYNLKSNRLLSEMDRLNKLSSNIEFKTPDDKITYMELQKSWIKANDELDKLHKWFKSTSKNEV